MPKMRKVCPRSDAQLEAAKRNFAVFALKGMLARMENFSGCVTKETLGKVEKHLTAALEEAKAVSASCMELKE